MKGIRRTLRRFSNMDSWFDKNDNKGFSKNNDMILKWVDNHA